MGMWYKVGRDDDLTYILMILLAVAGVFTCGTRLSWRDLT